MTSREPNGAFLALRLHAATHYVGGMTHLALFERFHCLRGMEPAFEDFYAHPVETERLLDALTDYLVVLADRLGQLGVDAWFLTDDWGTQQALMIASEMWRRFCPGLPATRERPGDPGPSAARPGPGHPVRTDGLGWPQSAAGHRSRADGSWPAGRDQVAAGGRGHHLRGDPMLTGSERFVRILMRQPAWSAEGTSCPVLAPSIASVRGSSSPSQEDCL